MQSEFKGGFAGLPTGKWHPFRAKVLVSMAGMRDKSFQPEEEEAFVFQNCCSIIRN